MILRGAETAERLARATNVMGNSGLVGLEASPCQLAVRRSWNGEHQAMDGGHESDGRIRKVCGLVQSMSVLIPEAGCELDEAIATYDTIMTPGVLELPRAIFTAESQRTFGVT